MHTELKKIDAYRWKVPRSGSMRVPGIVYASADMIGRPDQKEPIRQVANEFLEQDQLTVAVLEPLPIGQSTETSRQGGSHGRH